MFETIFEQRGTIHATFLIKDWEQAGVYDCDITKAVEIILTMKDRYTCILLWKQSDSKSYFPTADKVQRKCELHEGAKSS